MNSEHALPALESAQLTRERVEGLFADIARATTVLAVLVKGGPEERAAAPTRDLAAARTALLSGAVPSVQLRYVHEGTEWWDTVMRAGDGYRLVRARAPTLR